MALFPIEVKLFPTILSAALAALLAAVSCGKSQPDPDAEYKGLEAVSYTASDENIPNPERGFYSAKGYHDLSGQPSSQTAIDVARRFGRTLFLYEFYLTDYVESDIAEEYLTMIRNVFQGLRDGGAKCILRFAYSDGHEAADKPWDATEEQVLRHVAQLKPLLQEYYDVIFVLQAGFVGSWGEWYYTDHFVSNPKTAEDYAPRKHLLDALLDALPEERQIELRTPAFKMNIYGYGVADTITVATAHQGTVQSRLGGHNDCYLASANDTGTYHSDDERTYWSAESRYTIMGGETCGTSQFCHCDPFDDGSVHAHGTMIDMAEYHFTYVNNGYHQKVLQRWKDEGCYEQIEKRLGYRLTLLKAFFTPSPAPGTDMRVVLKINNSGFSAVQNPRDAELVLTDASGKVAATQDLGSDPRYWMPGNTTVVDTSFKLPAGLSGEYKLWLNLPDPCKTLRGKPVFSIRLANEDVWDETTGYNLLKTIKL